MNIIEISNLNKKYFDKVIFKDFSLSIKKGEMIAISGRSGCGKSTLLNMIGLIEKFDSGEIIIDGVKNIKINSKLANKFLREKISYLFQNFALVDEETGEENLRLAIKHTIKNTKKIEEEIIRCLKFVGLEGCQKNYIYELSGGEQQRVAIARLMLKPSEIILADEPTGSLDEENRDIIISLLKELNESGKTIIIVTHDNYVAKQADRIIFL